MKSEQEQLKEEIRYVKEILAQQDKMSQIGFSKMLDSEQEITIPFEYQHLVEQKRSSLQTHLDRLEEDLEDLKNRKDACDFNRKVQLRRGKERGEE